MPLQFGLTLGAITVNLGRREIADVVLTLVVGQAQPMPGE